jgi:hypothetical protein
MGADSSWGHIVTGKPFGQVPFRANVELLRLFLTYREDIVESIEAIPSDTIHTNVNAGAFARERAA